jgi:hypothetical protein
MLAEVMKANVPQSTAPGISFHPVTKMHKPSHAFISNLSKGLRAFARPLI